MKPSWNSLFPDLSETENKQLSEIITPNRRLSTYLSRLQLNEHLNNPNSGSSLIPINITPIEYWLKQRFTQLQELCSSPWSGYRVLTPQQEKLLWQTIVQKHKKTSPNLLSNSSLNDAIQAYLLLQQWGASKEDVERSYYYIGIDQTSFFKWVDEFEQHCAQHRLMSPARLPGIICTALEQNQLPIETSHYFYGFDEPSPLIQKLQNILDYKGLYQSCPLPEHEAKNQQLVQCNSEEEEIRLAANWCKHTLETESDSSIAIVFPSLQEKRELVFSIFSETLQSDAFAAGSTLNQLPFNISSGISLAKVPLIKSARLALNLLRISSKNTQIEIEDLRQVLTNPFLLEQKTNRNIWLKIDQTLSAFNKEKIKKHDYSQLLDQAQSLGANVDGMHAILSHNKAKQLSYFEWRSFFILSLEQMAWLKDRELNSDEYQASKRFVAVLEQFANLDKVAPPCDLNFALGQLEDLLQSEIFQTESKDEAKKRINILGVLEAAAQDFDHIWLCEMNNLIWPPAPKPNPFLPSALQRDWSMPHSSARRELDFCLSITDRFKRHSQNLIFSYALMKGDEDQEISPLLKPLKRVSLKGFIAQEQFAIQPSLAQQVHQSAKIDYFTDSTLIPLQAEEIVKGGQGLIKEQALCPFKSFSQHRLKVNPLEEPEAGLSAMDRGNILHRFMEVFWTRHKHQDELLALDDEELRVEITKVANQIRSEIQTEFIDDAALLELELLRSQEITFQFLSLEKQRPSFKVLANEMHIKYEIEGLELNLRIDRIDELDDGDELIIDYKSGSNHIKSWHDPRIEEPQLPLYLLSREKAKALAFGQLSRGNAQKAYLGLSNGEVEIPGIVDCENPKKNKLFLNNWSDQVESWENDLKLQAKNFTLGHTLVDPKDPIQTCQYCPYQRFCRVQERELVQEDSA